MQNSVKNSLCPESALVFYLINRKDSWLNLTLMLLGCDELSFWSIIYVLEEIKSEHLCAYPEVIQSCTQSLSEIVSKHLCITSLPPSELCQ